MMFPTLRSTDNWLANSFGDFFNDNWLSKPKATTPAINVKENEKQYDVEIAVPGMKKDDFDVNVTEDGCLEIKMEHKEEKKDENKQEHYLRREFSYSSYHQALILPDDVEHDKIEAKVENGVLHVTLPRKGATAKVQCKIDVI